MGGANSGIGNLLNQTTTNFHNLNYTQDATFRVKKHKSTKPSISSQAHH